MGIDSTNTELQSKLQQAIGQIKGLNFNANGLGNIAQAGGNGLSGSLWTIVQNAENAVNGEDKQKAEAYSNLLEGIFNIISFANNHQAKAQKEVKKNSDDIDKTGNDADKTSQEIQDVISQTTSDITTNTNNIQDALGKLKDLDSNNKDIENLKQEILEKLQVIEENKKKLNDPEQREEALKLIIATAGEINTLSETIAANITLMQTTFDEQQQIIADNVNQVTEQICTATQSITEGAEKLSEYITKETAAGAQATGLTASGTEQTGFGAYEVAAGQAINSNAFSALFSGGKGVKLVTDGNGRIAAGQTKITGGIQNLGSAVAEIGKIGTDLTEFSELANGLGKIGDGVTQLVGTYDSVVAPYIESIGTYNAEAIQAANTALQADVKNWQNGVNPKEAENGQDKENKEDSVKQFRAAFGI